MLGSISGSIGDPVLGIMALLSVACTGYLALEYLREIQKQRKVLRVRARLRRKYPRHE
ncbi:MAG TPA: hypothetical protein VN578_14450 [Candidatus Binatia bacterium]|jgi:hypothetical protein|nr:hypothetical protein [Candidatus Binatia bacterium]